MATRRVLFLVLLLVHLICVFICATSNGLVPDVNAAAAGGGDTSPSLLGGGVANKGEERRVKL